MGNGEWAMVNGESKIPLIIIPLKEIRHHTSEIPIVNGEW
jgi:hypothetical protein